MGPENRFSSDSLLRTYRRFSVESRISAGAISVYLYCFKGLRLVGIFEKIHFSFSTDSHSTYNVSKIFSEHFNSRSKEKDRFMGWAPMIQFRDNILHFRYVYA